jgi:hypothetical protein
MQFMKKLMLTLTLVTIVGCASASDRLCEENQKCQGADDPAKECADQRAECEEDEDCAASQEKCKEENEAVAACVLAAESSCQGVGDLEFYLPDDENACEEELETFLDCIQ